MGENRCSAGQQPRAVPCDYDTDPGRWAANQAFQPPGTEVSGMVTQRIIAGDAGSPVLELGGGTGPLIWARAAAIRACP